MLSQAVAHAIREFWVHPAVSVLLVDPVVVVARVCKQVFLFVAFCKWDPAASTGHMSVHDVSVCRSVPPYARVFLAACAVLRWSTCS